MANYSRLGIRIAPSSLMTSPFSMVFSMPCLTSSANSLAFPARFGNSMTLSKDFLAFSPIIEVIRDSKSEGAIVKTRIPYGARSRASGSVMDLTAPLLAAYATCKLLSRQFTTGAAFRLRMLHSYLAWLAVVGSR